MPDGGKQKRAGAARHAVSLLRFAHLSVYGQRPGRGLSGCFTALSYVAFAAVIMRLTSASMDACNKPGIINLHVHLPNARLLMTKPRACIIPIAPKDLCSLPRLIHLAAR
jgi:hypothetical protein